jgi:adenylate kinase family enzyme
MKIQIIGYSGSGKSTMAAELGRQLGLPVLHLDNAHWYGNWQERSDEEMSALVEAFLNEHESWVIDGNYSRIAPTRFEESDLTVFFNFARLPCFFAAWGRYRKYRGTPRESCPCPEKLDRTFRRWLLFESRTKKRRQQYLVNLAKTGGERVILKNRKQANAFLAAFLAKHQGGVTPK